MISTRLTEKLGIRHPIIQAPMALAAGGKLAAAVTNAGGLGLIGGAYGDGDWLREQFEAAGNHPIGCGFITWSVARKPHLLEMALDHSPKVMFLSFGDPAPLVPPIKAAGIPLICQVQTVRDALHAIDLGAEIIVAQGAEAGGHGEKRATFTLVPEIADAIASQAPETILCAAGGVGDGRGLAAALMLGADGVVVGSRFWATEEALVHPNLHNAAIAASGDDTIRSNVMDLARELDWPKRYNARVLKNDFTDKWHDDTDGLKAVLDAEAARWREALKNGDTSTANTFVGEVTGLITSIPPAAEIVEKIIAEAEALLHRRFVGN